MDVVCLFFFDMPMSFHEIKRERERESEQREALVVPNFDLTREILYFVLRAQHRSSARDVVMPN